MSTQTKTPQELALEAARASIAKAAEVAKAKALEKAQKDADKKAAAEAAKAKRVADAQAKRDAKAAEVQARKDKAAADKKAKEDAKLAAAAAKEAKKQPEQNGVRRPSPDGKCGKAWALMDQLSQALGQPVAIADLLAVSRTMDMNDNMVRSNYAAWRKFNGVVGRVLSQADSAKAQVAAAAKEAADKVLAEQAAAKTPAAS